jgi:hypothetical protein
MKQFYNPAQANMGSGQVMPAGMAPQGRIPMPNNMVSSNTGGGGFKGSQPMPPATLPQSQPGLGGGGMQAGMDPAIRSRVAQYGMAGMNPNMPQTAANPQGAQQLANALQYMRGGQTPQARW